MPRVLSLTALLSAALAGPATATPALVDEVRACRQLAEAARRVACYDAMKLPDAPAAAAATAADPARPAAPAADAVQKFGQQSIKARAGTPELQRIESRIPGRFEGWRANTRLAFENGQVWRIDDDSEALYELQNPRVIVHRGLLGAFFLEIEGVPFKVRVVRVR